MILSRPDKLNALNSEMMSEIESLSRDFLNYEDIRVVIFSGQGKHFSAGMDLKDDRVVSRNLVKRRLRTLARGCLGCSFRNRDVVVRVFPSVNKASFLQLRDSWDFFRAKVDQL